MALVRVPRVFRESLLRLKELPDDAVSGVNSALEVVPDYSLPSKLSDVVHRATQDLGQELDSYAFVQTLISLRTQVGLQTLAADEADIASFATDLAASPDIEIEGEDARRAFAERIASLMWNHAIATAAAAVDVFGEDERIFEAARVLTDLRPVFGAHPERRPAAALIVNTLKIACFTGNGHEEFFVALDQDDLEALKKVLDRAMTKTETMRSLLRDAGITEVGIAESASEADLST